MTWIPYVTMFLLMMVGLLLIFIILLQRGRGGGLAGALGGMGGTSAFGTRAGDVFTKITVVLAIIWTILAAGNVYALRITGKQYKGGSIAVPTAPAVEQGAGAGATNGDEPSNSPSGMPVESSTVPSNESHSSAPATDGAKPAEKPAEAPASTGQPEQKP